MSLSIVIGYPFLGGQSCLSQFFYGFLFVVFCFCWLVDSSKWQATWGKKRRGWCEATLCDPNLLCDQDAPCVNKAAKQMNVCVKVEQLESHLDIGLCQRLNLVTDAHAQTLPRILCDDLSAGFSSAMNERNCSEVSVYGGPRSLGGENQSSINTCSILSALRACTHGFDVRVTLNRAGWPSRLWQACAHTHTFTCIHTDAVSHTSAFKSLSFFSSLYLFFSHFFHFPLFLWVFLWFFFSTRPQV